MKPTVALPLLILCLSACGGPSDEDVLTADKIRASESAPELPDIQLSENPEPPPAPPTVEENMLNAADNAVENEVIEVGVPGTIPPAFQALWGAAPADCQRGQVVGTALLITPNELVSANSTASLQGVLGDYPARFEGRFADESGYEHREQMELTGSSNTLVRVSGNQRLIYKRCGAARPTG
jgi:hypothetical protein